jgi:predicted transposase/invertase (TIGR01784 family)
MLDKEHPTVQPAVKKLNRISESERIRALFESREKARRDALSWQYEAKMQAERLAEMREAQDRKEGREEGRNEEKQAIARKMLELEIPIEQIMLVTGLSREMVLEMKS